MKATLTINVEITAEELMALGEKLAEINGTIPENRYHPDPPPSTDSWAGKKVKVKPGIFEYVHHSSMKEDKEYIVKDDLDGVITMIGVNGYIRKDQLILV